MSWVVGFDSTWDRDIGYGVPATCDHPDCDAKIDRGLSYVCGGEPYGGDEGCGLYFCSEHRNASSLCSKCAVESEPFAAKPDAPEWTAHKATHESWAKWREQEHT